MSSPRFLFAALILALYAPGLARAANGAAAVVLADDGGLDVPAQKAVRGLVIGELRKRGINVSDDQAFEGVRALDSSLSEALRRGGGTRLFALRVNGQLGRKIPFTFEEVSPDKLSTVFAASMTAASLDESDVILPRLVDAVIDRRSPESTARIDSVTEKESQPFAKKPGERFFTIGLPIALYAGRGDGKLAGFSIGYMYEADVFRVGVEGELAANKALAAGGLFLDSAWVPLTGEVSPYLGGGLGYMGADDSSGLGGKLEAGVEAFRLHGLRLMAGVDVLFPFFATHQDGANRVAYPAAHVLLAF